ncbi:alginate O-acetyltransferase complex protein AlgJ [Rhizobium mongolense subsp. loessense]|uniref:Alginate O-acetyltransferase complex protein AlgJ n=2 Tax=Rhizobium mongolense TaxID=57676 RepID=A0A1G4RWG0_9HYPH|nr:alginate O-acetyltransferase complex protein AlgJ [Rhizobium mongolense subsp. loessense]
MDEFTEVVASGEIDALTSKKDGRRLNAKLAYLPALSIFILFACGVAVLGHFWNSKEMADHRQSKRSLADVIQGREALAVERIYKDVFPIRDFSTGLLNLISFKIFGEARKGLIKGSDGWFFSDEEFSWNRKSLSMLEKHLNFVEDTLSTLREAGIEPILLLIPEKADIYRDKLGDVAVPSSREHFYENVRLRLITMGVPVPDLREAFLQAREQKPVFLKSDTHWTVQGAGVAAGSVAQVLAHHPDLKHKEFTLKPEEEIVHMGDLYKFAKFSIFEPFVPMPGDALRSLAAMSADASLDDLLSDENEGPEVAMVGSSYSANAKWSFEAQLKAEARVDVINFAEEGKGPFAPMETFLKEKLHEQKQLKYVIWEMPLRYFDEVAY